MRPRNETEKRDKNKIKAKESETEDYGHLNDRPAAVCCIDSRSRYGCGSMRILALPASTSLGTKGVGCRPMIKSHSRAGTKHAYETAVQWHATSLFFQATCWFELAVTPRIFQPSRSFPTPAFLSDSRVPFQLPRSLPTPAFPSNSSTPLPTNTLQGIHVNIAANCQAPIKQ